MKEYIFAEDTTGTKLIAYAYVEDEAYSQALIQYGHTNFSLIDIRVKPEESFDDLFPTWRKKW
jgi:hypothetical protein